MKWYRLLMEVVMLGIFLGIAIMFGRFDSPDQRKEALGAYAMLRAALYILIEAHLPRRKDRRPPIEVTLDLSEYYVDRNGVTRRRDPSRW